MGTKSCTKILGMFFVKIFVAVEDFVTLAMGKRILVGKCVLKKSQTTPRPSEHPPVMGGKMSKRLGGIKRLQIQNLFITFKQVPRCR